MMKKRPDKLTYSPCNDIGFIVESACRLPELKCYVENGSVLFWASIIDTAKGNDDREIEALQYLTPEVAMKMSKALERCAIQALKDNS